MIFSGQSGRIPLSAIFHSTEQAGNNILTSWRTVKICKKGIAYCCLYPDTGLTGFYVVSIEKMKILP